MLNTPKPVPGDPWQAALAAIQFPHSGATLEAPFTPEMMDLESTSAESEERVPKGFSLLELLIVIAVIAILASLLGPALSNARVAAWRAACFNNQRQMTLAWILYSDENQGGLVENGIGTPSPQRRWWVSGGAHSSGYISDSKLLSGQFAAFHSYLPGTNVYKCPADRAEDTLGKRSRSRSYSMNSYMNEVGTALFPGYLIFRKSSDIEAAKPSHLFLFLDVQPESICMPTFWVFMPGSTGPGHTPGSYHHRAGVVSFADGHVETKIWSDPRTFQPRTHWYPENSNPDLEWIQDRATVPLPK